MFSLTLWHLPNIHLANKLQTNKNLEARCVRRCAHATVVAASHVGCELVLPVLELSTVTLLPQNVCDLSRCLCELAKADWATGSVAMILVPLPDFPGELLLRCNGVVACVVADLSISREACLDCCQPSPAICEVQVGFIQSSVFFAPTLPVC